MIEDQVRTTANVHVTAIDRNGKVIERRDVSNTTVRGLDSLIARSISGSFNATESASEIAVGNGDGLSTYGRTQLFRRVETTNIDEYETGEDYVVCYGFLSGNQANVEDGISECGVVSSDGRLLNHATFDSINKHSGRIINFAVRIGSGPVER